MKAQRIAFFGVMGALSLVLSFIESMFIPDIPFLPVGAKPGLSNIVTMYVVEISDLAGGIYITLIKAGFALVTRGTTASIMSLCGGLLSTFVTALMIKKGKKIFSFLGIGIAGAVMHNLGQLIAACLISGTPALLGYGKYLMIFAIITGTVTGSMLLVIMPGINKISNTMKLRKYDKEMKA